MATPKRSRSIAERCSVGNLEVRLERVVPKAADDVWAFVVEGFFANHSKWDPAVTECRPLDGAARVERGVRGVEVRRFGGKQEAEFEVTEVEPRRRFVFRNTSGPFELLRTYTFEPSGPGGTETRMTFTFEMAPKGGMKIVFPLFRGTIRKQVETNIDRLARLMGDKKEE